MARRKKSPRQAWIDRNPLKLARKARGETCDDVFGRLGVSMSIVVRYWECGRRRPNAKSVARIAEYMGEGILDVERAWNAWLNERPA